MFVPADLYQAAADLDLENPLDEVHRVRLLSRPEMVSEAGLRWLAALVARRGVRFDRENPEHCRPHSWRVVKFRLGLLPSPRLEDGLGKGGYL